MAPSVRERALMRAQAAAYLRACHDADDRLAVVLIQREGARAGKVEQKFYTAGQAASEKVQRYLRYRNAHGADIYCSANPIRPGVRRRTAKAILEARWLYADIDERGDETLRRIDDDAGAGRLPSPTAVIRTSKGRYQVLWRIEACATRRAERSLRALAAHYRTDPAATDCARVLRLPGFRSRKRNEEVRLVRFCRTPPARVQDFERVLPPAPRDRRAQAPRGGGGKKRARKAKGLKLDRRDHSRSGQDWAYTRQELRNGRAPAEIEAELVRWRSDKPNPAYYAATTVRNALRSLGRNTGPAGSRRAIRDALRGGPSR